MLGYIGREQLKDIGLNLSKVNFVNITHVYEPQKSSEEKFTDNPVEFYSSTSGYKI